MSAVVELLLPVGGIGFYRRAAASSVVTLAASLLGV